MKLILLKHNQSKIQSTNLLICKVRKLFTGIALFLMPFFVCSQIINIESQRTNTTDSIAWNGAANLGFNFVDNGKKVTTIRGGLGIEYVRFRHLWLSISNFNFGKVDDSDFVNNGFQHLRYNFEIKHRILWEAFTQLQFDERINLKVRYLLGTGPRFGIVHKDPFYVYGGIAYMYEYDKEVQGEPEVSIFHRDHRLSTYLALSIKPTSNLTILSTSYYQPVLTDPDDLRLSSRTSLLIKITEKLDFSSAFSITYDSRVPEGVQNIIYSTSNGIKLKF